MVGRGDKRTTTWQTSANSELVPWVTIASDNDYYSKNKGRPVHVSGLLVLTC